VTEREVPGRDLPTFRGEARLDLGLLELLAVLGDLDRYSEWVAECTDARELQRIDDRNRVNYTRTAAPWPVWDRDVVLRSRVHVDIARRRVRIRFRNVSSPLQGEVEGVVRMPRLEGFYLLQAVDAGHTDVVYQVDADPGGSLPRWAVRLATKTLPLETIRGLRRQALATRGQYDERIARMRRELQERTRQQGHGGGGAVRGGGP